MIRLYGNDPSVFQYYLGCQHFFEHILVTADTVHPCTDYSEDTIYPYDFAAGDVSREDHQLADYRIGTKP